MDLVFYDEISDIKIITEGSTTTSATVLYDILRKISANAELKFELKSENKLSLKSENSDFNLLNKIKIICIMRIKYIYI